MTERNFCDASENQSEQNDVKTQCVDLQSMAVNSPNVEARSHI